MDSKQLSIGEKWAADLRSYEKGARVKTTVPQCEGCAHFIKGNALHCRKFSSDTKPRDVMFARKECSEFHSSTPLQIDISNEAQSRLFGGVFGFCVGDMLGVPVEFSSRQERMSDPARELRAYGTYHQPFGTWSDDTSLMLCLMDAMCEEDLLNQLSRNMLAFYKNGMFTPNGVVFDIGNSTAQALQKMAAGVSPVKCGGSSTMDNGNGSLMRILPLAFARTKWDDHTFIRMVEDVSSFTHAHPRSKLACIFYTYLASELYAGVERFRALDNTIRFITDNCKRTYASELASYSYVLDKSFLAAESENIRSSGYVIHTLEALLWSFYRTNSFRDAVLTAVNLGGDTDTIAALAGGLAGIWYGYSAIPSNWVENILKKQAIADLSDKFRESVTK